MRTVARTATKKIAEIREVCTVVTDLNYPDQVNNLELAFFYLGKLKEARLIEYVPGKAYAITWGGTRERRQVRTIALTAPVAISAGMQGVTYRPDHGELTVPVDVHRVFVTLNDQGEPVTMAEIDHDGLDVTTEADKISPDVWVWVPTPEYLAEQAAIAAAAERAEQERAEEEEATYRDCALPLGADARDGRCERCAREADENDAQDYPEEESATASADAVINPGDTVEVAGTLVTVVRRLYLGERLIILCTYQDSMGFAKFGIADFGSVSQPSIVAWGENKQAAEVKFVEWTEVVRKSLGIDHNTEAEKATENVPEFIMRLPLAYIPMRCVCIWWIPEGAESAYLTETRPECAVHSPESHQEETNAAPALVVTESAKQELSELLEAWEGVSQYDHADFLDASRALAEAVATLLGKELQS